MSKVVEMVGNLKRVIYLFTWSAVSLFGRCKFRILHSFQHVTRYEDIYL